MDVDHNLIYEKICCQLKKAGYKCTPQRRLTIDVLLENAPDLLTIEQIHEAVQVKSPTIGLATIYRTLDILVELDAFKKVATEVGLHSYELNFTTVESQPYYLLCIQCGKIVAVRNPIFKDMDKDLVHECEFKIINYQLTFHGHCINCQKK